MHIILMTHDDQMLMIQFCLWPNRSKIAMLCENLFLKYAPNYDFMILLLSFRFCNMGVMVGRLQEQLGWRPGVRVCHSAARDYRHGAQFILESIQNFDKNIKCRIRVKLRSWKRKFRF